MMFLLVYSKSKAQIKASCSLGSLNFSRRVLIAPAANSSASRRVGA
jgi:hypothetical protein